MKQLIPFIALFCVTLSSSAVLAEDEFLCYDANYKLGRFGYTNCKIDAHSRNISPKIKEQYKSLEKQFIQESIRLQKLSLSPEQYYKNYLKAKRAGKICEFNNIICLSLELTSLFGLKNPWWRLDLANKKVEVSEIFTPLQEGRFGPYKKTLKKKLSKLQKEFIGECIAQNVFPEIAAKPRMLKLVLQASSAMISNLPRQKRQKLLDEWRSSCNKRGEHPSDVTIRFLLSAPIRNVEWLSKRMINTYGSPGAWTCHGNFSLYHQNNCGTIYFWKTEEKKLDVTRKFRGIVKTLPEARTKKH